MELNLLPAPEALKNLFIAFTLNSRLALYALPGAESTYHLSSWWMEYKKKKDTYTCFPNGDEDDGASDSLFYMAFTKEYSFILSRSYETGVQLPDEAIARIPENIRKAVCKVTYTDFDFIQYFLWSTDGITWNQLEDCEQEDPLNPYEKLGEFLTNGSYTDYCNYANADNGVFQAKYPLLHQLYKRVPFNDEMLIEGRLETPDTGKLSNLKLPKPDRKAASKALAILNYPSDFSSDYQLVPSPEYVDQLLEKKYYKTALYCIAQLLKGKKSGNKEDLMRKAANICVELDMYMTAMSLYQSLNIDRPDLYLHAAEKYMEYGLTNSNVSGKELVAVNNIHTAIKYYLLGFEAQGADYTIYLEKAKELSKSNPQGRKHALPLYEKVLELHPKCHEANDYMIKEFKDFEYTHYNESLKYAKESLESKNEHQTFWNQRLEKETKKKYHHEKLTEYFDNCDPAQLKPRDYASISCYLLKKRQFEDAYAYIIKGLEHGENRGLKNLQADCLLQLKRYDEAIAIYKEIQLGSILEDYNWEGNIERVVQDYQRDIDELVQLVATGNDLAQEYDRLRQYYESIAAYFKAGIYYEKSILLDPTYIKEEIDEEDDDDDEDDEDEDDGCYGHVPVFVCMPIAMKTKEGVQDIFHRLVESPYNFAYSNEPGDKYMLDLIEEFHTSFPNDVVKMNIYFIGSMLATVADKNNKVRDLLIKETIESGFDGIFESSPRGALAMIETVAKLEYYEIALKHIDYYEECCRILGSGVKDFEKARKRIKNKLLPKVGVRGHNG